MNDNSSPAPVILMNDREPTLAAPQQKPVSTLRKWETTARERMKAAIKKFSKPLADLVADDEVIRLLSHTVLRPECLGGK